MAFVTGAGSGIGQACTLELVRGGATGILITDLNEKGLEQTVRMSRAINENLPILAEVADITLDGTATRLVSKTAEKFGRLDYALNVAGKTAATLVIGVCSDKGPQVLLESKVQ